MKQCSKCKEVKPETEFHKDKNKKDGLQSRCKQCIIKVVTAEYNRTTQWVKEYKISQGCMDCGWNRHHSGLEFDHREARNGDNSKLVARMTSLPRVKREVEKCDVVCGTCHRVRTWNRAHPEEQFNNAPLA